MITYGLVKQNSAYARNYRSSYTDSDVTRIAPKYPTETKMGITGPSDYALRKVVEGGGVRPRTQKILRAKSHPQKLQRNKPPLEKLMRGLASALMFTGAFSRQPPVDTGTQTVEEVAPTPTTPDDTPPDADSNVAPESSTLGLGTVPPESSVGESTVQGQSPPLQSMLEQGVVLANKELERAIQEQQNILKRLSPATSQSMQEYVHQDFQTIIEVLPALDEKEVKVVLSDYYEKTPESIREQHAREEWQEMENLRKRLSNLLASPWSENSLEKQAQATARKYPSNFIPSTDTRSLMDKVKKEKEKNALKMLSRRASDPATLQKILRRRRASV